ncbi:exopolysaccharide biosynthesis polyprenyl glycosylphosphotransferase [Streptomyces triticirhizae]|uniref:Exopolysaccharide biosynthesis polyprenyl glycosylphosphotransferase n=1 Tax=Streptomyces triticirhizae TaxID=2483353 RepID=A0A3M2L7F8_9ACTN|nr:exopolysaccharide biosynthesis polyprenyl glycosylphosphotransferase [Streptomyces triticirhizae]
MRHPDVSRSGSVRRPQVTGRWPAGRPDEARWYAPAAVAADAAGVLAPVLLVYHLTDQPRPLAAAAVATAGWLALRAAHGRYRPGRLGESRGLLASAHDWLLLLGLLAGLRAVLGEGSEVSAAALALLPAPLVTGLTAAALHRHLTQRRHRAEAVRRVLVVGEPDAVDAVTARLAAGTDHAYVTVGAVLLGPGELTSGVPPLSRLPVEPPAHCPEVPDLIPAGTDGSGVLAAARRQSADLVLLVPGTRLGGDRLRRLCWSVQDAGLALCVTSGLTEVARHRVTVASAAGLNLLHVAPPPRRGAPLLWKAATDRIVAALALVVLAPLFAALALAVRLDSPGPVLYRQTRIGHRGTPFTLWKFRTMVPDADRHRPALEAVNEHCATPLFKIRRDPRITRVGRLLRRTSLDELPQLVNVVRGEMALVGPRPPLPDEVARYGTVELRRLSVRPGLTGPWQVSGRSELSWDEGLALDLAYADNWTLTGDLDVLARTVRAVVSGRGAW